jgi:hypothetical protein
VPSDLRIGYVHTTGLERGGILGSGLPPGSRQHARSIPVAGENVAPLSRFDYDTVDDDNDHTAVGSYCR